MIRPTVVASQHRYQTKDEKNAKNAFREGI